MKIIEINKLQNNKQYLTYDLAFRIKALKALKNSIINHETEIYNALIKDLNKCDKETFLCEINEVLLEIDYHLKNLKKWILPKKQKATIQTFGTKSYIYHLAKGKVLIISPFNYPINLAFMPLVGAISAGNQVLLKPSPYTTYTNQVIKAIINDAFDPSHVAFIEDHELKNYEEIYNYQPNLIFFTGSTKVGKIIETECVKRNISYVTELGGMCPCILNDFSSNIIFDRIVWAKFLNAGQTCVSINYLSINKELFNEAIDQLIQAIKKQYNDVLKTNNMVKIINKNGFLRLTKIINENKNNIIYGGNYCSKKMIIEPTIIKINKNKIKAYGELFGPILFVDEYNKDDFEQTIEDINKIDNSPLAAYLISNSKQKIDYFIRNINAGSYCINDAITQILNHNLPFGGVYSSGTGSYHGYYSFLTMSWTKPVVINNAKRDFALKYIFNEYDLTKTKKLFKFLTKIKH